MERWTRFLIRNRKNFAVARPAGHLINRMERRR
jgi:hypothetical protein